MSNPKSILKDIYTKGFFHLFSANSLIHLIEFGSQLFVAWILLADDIGRIKSFQTYAAVGVVIAGVGFNTSILKLCSEKNMKDHQKQNLFLAALKTTFLFSGVVILLVVVLSYFNFISNDSITNKWFIYYSLSIPLLAVNNLLVAYYQALKAFKKVSVLLVIVRIIHVALIITLTYNYGLKGFIIGIIIGFLISVILLLVKSGIHFNLWKQTDKHHYLQNWELAKYAFLGNAINMITRYLDVFLLNQLIHNPNELGYYGFALTLIAGLQIVTTTTQQFVTPFYSEFSENKTQIKRAFKRSNRLFMLVILVVSILAAIMVPFIIKIVFSGKYDHSIFYFQILTIVWLIRSSVSLKGPFLLAIGKINVVFYIMLKVLLISIIPCYLLVLNYGIKGALYGQLFSAIVFFILVNFGFRKELHHYLKLK